MCTLTTQQLQRTWPTQLQALCKTMVGEGIPSTTLEKTNTQTYPEQVNENYTTRNRTPSQKASKFAVALLQHITATEFVNKIEAYGQEHKLVSDSSPINKHINIVFIASLCCS